MGVHTNNADNWSQAGMLDRTRWAPKVLENTSRAPTRQDKLWGSALRVLLLERWGPGQGKEVPRPKASPESPLHCQETINGRENTRSLFQHRYRRQKTHVNSR